MKAASFGRVLSKALEDVAFKRIEACALSKVNRGSESWPSPVAEMALEPLHTTHCYCCLDLKPEIVDRAGGGDASVGGFLSQLFAHKPQPNNASVLSTMQQASSVSCVSWEARLPLMNEQKPLEGKHRKRCDCFLTASTVGKKDVIGHRSSLWFRS